MRWGRRFAALTWATYPLNITDAVFFVILRELWALKLAELHLIVFGVLFILVVLFMPGGLLAAWARIRKSLARRSKPKGARVLPGEGN